MKIDWHEEWIDFSAEARNFMERLLTYEPRKRLGLHGAKEVKEHPFLAEIEWDKVMDAEPAFVPNVEDPESTDYFDPRGAIPQLFHDDELIAVGRPLSEASQLSHHLESSPGTNSQRVPSRDAISTPGSDDFGTFNFKNLSLLKQANDDVIKKMKSDQMISSLGDPVVMHHRKRSLSQRLKKPSSVSTNFEPRVSPNWRPPFSVLTRVNTYSNMVALTRLPRLLQPLQLLHHHRVPAWVPQRRAAFKATSVARQNTRLLIASRQTFSRVKPDAIRCRVACELPPCRAPTQSSLIPEVTPGLTRPHLPPPLHLRSCRRELMILAALTVLLCA